LFRDTGDAGASSHWEQFASIFTEAQISPRPHGFWTKAEDGQKAAKIVVV